MHLSTILFETNMFTSNQNNVAIKKKPIELLRERKNDKNLVFEYPLKVTHRKIALSVS